MSPPTYPYPFHSPDGRWWWNGQAWTPALSPDGRYWFDGQRWVRRSSSPARSAAWVQDLSRRTWTEGIVWLVLLGLWCPALASLAEENAAASTVAWVGGVLAGVAAAATLAFGARLGHRRLWRPAAVACLAGAGVLLFWFATITVTAPDPTNQNDHAVGIGVVLLAVPSVVVVGIILGVGACAGCGYRRLRSRVTR